jgi:hypothetical protein
MKQSSVARGIAFLSQKQLTALLKMQWRTLPVLREMEDCHASILLDLGDFGWARNGLPRHCSWRSDIHDTVGRIGR